MTCTVHWIQAVKLKHVNALKFAEGCSIMQMSAGLIFPQCITPCPTCSFLMFKQTRVLNLKWFHLKDLARMPPPSAQYSEHTAVYFRMNSSCFFYCALLPGGVIMDRARMLLFYQSSKYRPAQHKCINTALWTRSRASCTLSGCLLLWKRLSWFSCRLQPIHVYRYIYIFNSFLGVTLSAV